jgi:hypothetical protein
MNREERIVGVIGPIDWDDEGIPCEFSIYTLDEEDIVISAEKNTQRKLRNLVNRPVEITGMLSASYHTDERIIKPKKIKKLEADEALLHRHFAESDLQELKIKAPTPSEYYGLGF